MIHQAWIFRNLENDKPARLAFSDDIGRYVDLSIIDDDIDKFVLVTKITI